MHKQNLILHKSGINSFRSVIKTRHSRLIYIELKEESGMFTITDCYYTDRINKGVYYAAPKTLHTYQCPSEDLLTVIAAELDRTYYGIEIVNSFYEMQTEEFIHQKLVEYQRGYKFLIFTGEGDTINGIPSMLTTRFKNRIHRSIYLELRYHSNNSGVIADCHYCDRVYKERKQVIPETLTSIFFNYTRNAVIHMVNHELNTDFTDIIFITDNSINIDINIPLCGNI